MLSTVIFICSSSSLGAGFGYLTYKKLSPSKKMKAQQNNFKTIKNIIMKVEQIYTRLYCSCNLLFRKTMACLLFLIHCVKCTTIFGQSKKR